MLHFDFKAIISSRGYHVYKQTAWSDAKVNDKVKIEIETKHKYFGGWKIVGHVPREISRYIYFSNQKGT